ncbi:MAG: kinase [Candidatus Eremiobacteraeota bacterium]|nr:kinase [Candidatus Eremiobacteraeota bacterium]
MIISRTPFRISFFGGGTDYPEWYRQHGGAVLATTINKYCYITCRYLPPFFEHRIRVVYSKIEDCQTVGEIGHPAAREILRFLSFERGVEIHHDGDLPARSGMGSSSSFTVGLLNALYALKGEMLSTHRLAMESIHIEQEVLRENVGSQDQVLAAYGGFNHVTFMQNGEISVRPITVGSDRIRELNSHLMLFYTGVKRTASEIAGSYVQDMAAKKRQLRLMRELIDEGLSILNSKGDIRSFGELMAEAWQAKRSLSTSVSNPYVDEIYEAACHSGALGGKLTGAGGGGFMLLFVPPGCQAAVREKLGRLIYVPFKFEYSGSQIIFCEHEEDYRDIEEARLSQNIEAFRELGCPTRESPRHGTRGKGKKVPHG